MENNFPPVPFLEFFTNTGVLPFPGYGGSRYSCGGIEASLHAAIVKRCICLYLKEMNTNTTRWQSIDLLRGAIMVLMAIDHVRVYSGVPAGGVSRTSSLLGGSPTSVRRGLSSLRAPALFYMDKRSGVKADWRATC